MTATQHSCPFSPTDESEPILFSHPVYSEDIFSLFKASRTDHIPFNDETESQLLFVIFFFNNTILVFCAMAKCCIFVHSSLSIHIKHYLLSLLMLFIYCLDYKVMMLNQMKSSEINALCTDHLIFYPVSPLHCSS